MPNRTELEEAAIKLVNDKKIKDLVIENLQAKLRILKVSLN
jgi:hypothetical protein